MLAILPRPAYIFPSPPWRIRPTPESSMSVTNIPPVSPSLALPEVTGWRTLGLLTRYHWFVFAVVTMAWVLDCMDQQFFNIARKTAVTELLGPTATPQDVNEWAGFTTSVFLIGWAI